MSTITEIKQAIEWLPAAEREELLAWLKAVFDSPYRVAEPAVAYAQRRQRMSVEEYLAFEETSPIKHEYVAGEIFAMSGATIRHNAISLNISVALHAHLRGGPCKAFVNDVKARLKIGTDEIFYYPDVMVACGPLDMDESFLRNPKLIVEVLSPSTETIDRREKAMNYRQISTLEEYVLVAQRTPEVTVFRRKADWVPDVVTSADGIAELRSLDLRLPLPVIYGDAER